MTSLVNSYLHQLVENGPIRDAVGLGWSLLYALVTKSAEVAFTRVALPTTFGLINHNYLFSMKRVLCSLFLSGLLGGLTAQATPVNLTSTQSVTVTPGDYYSGLATGTGHKDHYVSLYGVGTPAYTQAIDAEYLQASRNLRYATENYDQHEIDFWSGYIDGLDRPLEEEF